MKEIPDDERRRFRRFPSNVSITFRCLDLSGTKRELKSLAAAIKQVTNISSMGMFIQTDEPYPEGSILETTFFFELQGREVKAICRVAWISKETDNPGMGVEITEVDKELYAQIVLNAKRSQWVKAKNENFGDEESSESDSAQDQSVDEDSKNDEDKKEETEEKTDINTNDNKEK